jgi:hypothetical protein
MSASDTKFRGMQGSPEHLAHIAAIAKEWQLDEATEAMLIVDDPNVDIEKRADAARDLEYLREESPEAYEAARQQYDKALDDSKLATLRQRPRPPFNPSTSRVGDVFSVEPPPPAFIIDRLLPRAHGVENAVGGAGKTTRHIWEAAHIILEREIYGAKVTQPGGVLIVTKEDDRELFDHRIHAVINAMPDLAPGDRKLIAENLHVLELTGTDERLAAVGQNGNLIRTSLAERIARGYEKEGLALIDFDPFNLFGPGERFINDGEAASLTAMAHLSGALKCAVRGTSHVSKAVGRDGTSDAHSGRGGAAGGDNSRFVWNYWQYKQERDKLVTPPYELIGQAEAGELYLLHIAKLTAARAAVERVWVVRQGFGFTYRRDIAQTPQDRSKAKADADARQVLAYLRDEAAQDVQYTTNLLEASAGRVGISRNRVRAALAYLKAQGLAWEADLPQDQRHGGRQTFLAVAPADELDTSKPISDQINESDCQEKRSHQ